MAEPKKSVGPAGLRRKLRKALGGLVGSECWSIIAGRGTCSSIMLDFGKKMPREAELKNRRLSEEQRKNRGESALYVTSVWRLDSAEGVICGAWENKRKGGLIPKGLRMLKGRTVDGFDLDDVGMDLVLAFSGGFRLKIFCDALNEIDQSNNYTLSTQGDLYIVGLRSVLRLGDVPRK